MINEKEAFLTHALSRNRTAHVKQSNCFSEIAFARYEVQMIRHMKSRRNEGQIGTLIGISASSFLPLLWGLLDSGSTSRKC
jgi:hypothetical protein